MAEDTAKLRLEIETTEAKKRLAEASEVAKKAYKAIVEAQNEVKRSQAELSAARARAAEGDKSAAATAAALSVEVSQLAAQTKYMTREVVAGLDPTAKMVLRHLQLADAEVKGAAGARLKKEALEKLNEQMTRRSEGKRLTVLFRELGDVIRGLPGPIGTAAQAVDTLKGRMDRSNQAGFASVGAMIGMTGAAVGLGVALSGVALSAHKQVDAVADLAERSGVSAQELSKYRAVSEQTDVSLEQLSGSLKKLSVNMVEARREGTAQHKIWAELGIPVTSSTEAMTALGDVFARLETEEDKVRLATHLFGEAGTQLLPILNQSSAALQEMFEKNRQFNLEINENTLRIHGEWEQTTKNITLALRGMAQTTADYWLPIMTTAAKWWSRLLGAEEDATAATQEGTAAIEADTAATGANVKGKINLAKILDKVAAKQKEMTGRESQKKLQFIPTPEQVATQAKPFEQAMEQVNLTLADQMMHYSDHTLEHDVAVWQARVQVAQMAGDAIMGIGQMIVTATGAQGEEAFKLMKAFRVAQAELDAIAAALSAFASTPGGLVVKGVMAGLVFAAAQAQVAAIVASKPPKMAAGGMVEGPSHSRGGVHRELEGGEVVMSRHAVRQIGRENLERANKDPSSLSGGMVRAEVRFNHSILDRLDAAVSDLYGSRAGRIARRSSPIGIRWAT